jgi:hypothetical protein
MYSSMAEYPQWFVITCSVLVVALGLWIVVKLIKVALWLFVVGVLISAGSYVAWYFFR